MLDGKVHMAKHLLPAHDFSYLSIFLPSCFFTYINRFIKWCVFCFLHYSFTANAIEVQVVTEYLPPYQTQNQDGSLGGFSTEVVHALFTLTGDTPDIEVLPWFKAYQRAKETKNMLIFSIARTKFRESLFHWVGKLKQEHLFIWGLSSRFPKPFDSLEQLQAYSIASSKSSGPEQYLTRHYFKHIYRLHNAYQNMAMLYNKRVDLVVGSELALRIRAKKMHYDFSKMNKLFEIAELNNDLCIAFNLDSDSKLVSRFQQAFIILEQQGVIRALRQKHAVPD